MRERVGGRVGGEGVNEKVYLESLRNLLPVFDSEFFHVVHFTRNFLGNIP
jgi:hypothetical protein